MKLTSILFDFDGTLSPSLPLWRRAFKNALAGYGISAADDDVVKHCFYRSWSDVAGHFEIQSSTAFELTVLEKLREAFLDAELFPSVRELLSHCRASGLKIALVTSSPREVISDVLPRLELDTLFDFVISGSDVTNHKPHPEPLLTTLAALGSVAEESLMVGDSTADILAGKAAGVRTALFLPEEHRSFYCFDKLKTTAPDHIFSGHHELPAIVGLPALALA